MPEKSHLATGLLEVGSGKKFAISSAGNCVAQSLKGGWKGKIKE